MIVLVVLFLVVLFVVADRLTEAAAARALAVKARETSLLAGDPSVDIHGFPFLTQAIRGRYSRIDVTTHGIHRGGLRLDTVKGTFEGVHLGLSAALNGRVTSVPIDHATGEVDITYPDLNAFLAASHLSVHPDGSDHLTVSGTATLFGAAVTVSGPVAITVIGGSLSLAPPIATLRGPGGVLPEAAARTVAKAFTVQVRLNNLPFGLDLKSVRVGPTDITITASATNIAVPVPADASQQPGGAP
ncbi:MAG TPA: DUF2993 domain-containing protein [Mycobacteriales bacterium]